MANLETIWKKQKPLTLLKDPLSPYLKALDAQMEAKSTITTEDLAKRSAAAKSGRKGIADTIKAMNPKLHKESIAWLGTLDKTVEKILSEIQAKQKEMAVYLREVQARRKDLVNNINVVTAKPSAQVAAVSIKNLQEYVAWSNKESNGVYSQDANTVSKYTSLSANLLNDLSKSLKEPKPSDADAVKKHNAKINFILGELKENAKKIGALGGVPVTKSEGIHSSVSLK